MTENPNFSLRVLHVASEIAPFKKTGGLGDVTASLPKALCRHGVDARSVMPAWPGVLDTASDLGCLRKRSLGQISIALNYRAYTARVWKAVCDNTPVYILDQPELFDHERIYPESMEAVEALPFIFLSLAPLELPETVGWKPQFLHAHDWQTAALPAALRWHKYYSRKSNGDYDSIFTIHNLAHQGIFGAEGLEGWGFSGAAYNPFEENSLEYYSQVNLMKGALTTCEAITTVSPRYSWEIQTPELGCGLDGVIRAHRDKLKGILNGIDRDIWNPETDKFIAKNYGAGNRSGKKACRKAMFKKFGWEYDERPVLAFIGRLAEQKGVDMMLEALEHLLPEEIRVVIIGSGNEYYNRKITNFTKDRADEVYTLIGFDEETARIAYAGSDIFLMPSSFEPCGLSQMIACAYGTIPVVHATGGLADTIIDADFSEDGTGFLFLEYCQEELLRAIRRALDARNSPARWQKIMDSAMGVDFSWEASAAEYIDLYNRILTS